MRKKFDFNKLNKELEKELASVKDSPRALIVMFDAYMMAALTEILALRFDSDVFENKPEPLRIDLAVEFNLISKPLAQNVRHLKQIRNMIAHTPDIHNKKFKTDINKLVRQIPILEGGMFSEHFSEDFIEASQIVYRSLETFYDNERKIYEDNFKLAAKYRKKRESLTKKKDKLWKLKGYI